MLTGQSECVDTFTVFLKHFQLLYNKKKNMYIYKKSIKVGHDYDILLIAYLPEVADVLYDRLRIRGYKKNWNSIKSNVYLISYYAKHVVWYTS